MKSKNNSLFIKYLLSYLIMFMIPTLMLTYFIYYTLLGALEEQYLKNSRQSLSQLVFMTNKSFEQMNSIREHLIINKNVKPNFDILDVKDAKIIIEELSKYTLSSSSLRDMALWFKGDQYVYTTSTTNTFDQYLSQNIMYEDEEAQQRLQQMGEIKTNVVIPYQKMKIFGAPRNRMTVMMPVNLHGYDAVILFFSDEFFGEAPGDESYLVLDEGGSLIRSLNLPEYVEDADLKRLWEEMDNGSEPGELGTSEEGLLVSVMKSEQTGWFFVKLATEQAVYGGLKEIQSKFIFLLWIIMLISVIFTAINMAMNYNPLRKLKKVAEELRGNSGKNRKNELIGIREAIHELFNENQSIKKSTASVLRLNFLQQLIKGRIVGQEQFEQRVDELCLDGLKGDCFFVLICSFKEAAAAPEVGDVEKILNSMFGGYCREHNESGTYIFLGSIDKKEALRLRYGLLDVQILLEHAAGSEVTVACGSLCSSFDELPRSYMDASLALDYRFIKGWNYVIEYGELVLNDNMGVAYPHQLFERLSYQIKSGDADQIGQALDDIISYVKKADLPLYYAKGLCYQLINSISAVITELNEKLTVRQSSLSYATVLAEYQTADELVDAVRNICLSICAFIRESKAKQEGEIIDLMKLYIHDNCCDINFSAQSIADRFSMSASALSLFFKKQYGGNISDYITAVRMEQAKKLLTAGGKSLNEVAEAVGYANTSSFIRRFKVLNGITPGQFSTMNLETDYESENSAPS